MRHGSCCSVSQIREPQRALSEALRAESICTRSLVNIDDALTVIAKDRPSLAIIEHDPPRIDGIGLCRAIRRQAWDERRIGCTSRG